MTRGSFLKKIWEVFNFFNKQKTDALIRYRSLNESRYDPVIRRIIAAEISK